LNKVIAVKFHDDVGKKLITCAKLEKGREGYSVSDYICTCPLTQHDMDKESMKALKPTLKPSSPASRISEAVKCYEQRYGLDPACIYALKDTFDEVENLQKEVFVQTGCIAQIETLKKEKDPSWNAVLTSSLVG